MFLNESYLGCYANHVLSQDVENLGTERHIDVEAVVKPDGSVYPLFQLYLEERLKIPVSYYCYVPSIAQSVT